MSLEYAADHLSAAMVSLATTEGPLATRLQVAWDEHVQMLWMQPCLTADLLRDFRDLWHRYTAPSDDRTSTALRPLSAAESVEAVEALAALSTRTLVASARATGDETLARLADLD